MGYNQLDCLKEEAIDLPANVETEDAINEELLKHEISDNDNDTDSINNFTNTESTLDDVLTKREETEAAEIQQFDAEIENSTSEVMDSEKLVFMCFETSKRR